MFCRVCQSSDVVPIFEEESQLVRWFHCWGCGSHFSDSDYERIKELYDEKYVTVNIDRLGDRETALRELEHNLNLFLKYQGKVAQRDFLDVGHNDGLMLTRMQDEAGWSVHGFDVNPNAYLGPHTTIHPVFRASLFPQRYSGVHCREVIEHVEGWRQFLAELAAVTAPRGLLQIQTPKPMKVYDPYVYSAEHLQILAPYVLTHELQLCGFDILESKQWDQGQLYMCQKNHGF